MAEASTNVQEVIRQLHTFGEDVKKLAARGAKNAADDAANDILRDYDTYGVVNNKLKRGVKVQDVSTQDGPAFKVKSSSPHAHLIEYGTVKRHAYSRRGAGRGQMLGRRRPSKPRDPIVGRAAVKQRRRWEQTLTNIVNAAIARAK